ncbi:MAG: hypothetical protein ACM3SY_09990 [Candidatus Omnitrophota bacterium]
MPNQAYQVRVNGQMLGVLSQNEILSRCKYWKKPNITVEIAPTGSNFFISLEQFLNAPSNYSIPSPHQPQTMPHFSNSKPKSHSKKILIASLVILLCLIAWGGYTVIRSHAEKERQEEAQLQIQKALEEVRLKDEMEQEQKRLEEERARQQELIESERRRKALGFAEEERDKIIDTIYDGGENKSVEVTEWEYFPDNDSYRIKVKLNWNGNINPSNSYAAEGYITLNADGTGAKWNPTWVNSTLTEYQKNRNILGAIVGVIYALDND